MKKKGFTIIELMIVIAIIGLLAAIVIPSFCKARNTACARKLGLECAWSNGHPTFYNPKTFEVVELSDNLESIVNVVGVINLSKTTLEKWKGMDKDAKEAFLLPPGTDIKSYTKKIEEQKKVVAIPPVTKVAVETPKPTQSKDTPEVIVVHGVRYIREDTIQTADGKPRSIKDNDKWKYIEESFK